jgi:hypothetical protein
MAHSICIQEETIANTRFPVRQAVVLHRPSGHPARLGTW